MVACYYYDLVFIDLGVKTRRHAASTTTSASHSFCVRQLLHFSTLRPTMPAIIELFRLADVSFLLSNPFFRRNHPNHITSQLCSTPHRTVCQYHQQQRTCAAWASSSPAGCITELITYGRASITSNFLIKLVISQTAILCSACYFSKPTDVPPSRVIFISFHSSIHLSS